MRVVHLACVAPPEIGGIGSVAAREVALLRARGVDAHLIVPETLTQTNNEAERSFIERIKPVWRVGNAALLPELSELVNGADIVHLHYPFYGTAERLLLTGQMTPPVVMTFHMDATAGGLKGLAFALHRKLIQPYLLARAAAVLVSSFDYARRSSLSPWFSAHPERVIELPFGVDTDFFSPGPSVRNRFAVPADAPTVLFVGGLDRAHAFKGVSGLLAAFRTLDPTTHLLVVGEGDLKLSYEEQAQAFGIASRVHFLGRADDQTLRDAYRSADVFAFPSTSAAEAFGLVVLEAAACGLPVVASDLPGVRTVVRHGETGLLIRPKDVEALTSGLLRLLSDPGLRTSMGARAQVFVREGFSWDRHADGLMDVYQKVCASRS